MDTPRSFIAYFRLFRAWQSWALGLSSILIVEFSLSATSPHYVFAHYMVCFATYGQSLDGYRREIREAQAAGIDGFALNVGAWSGPDTYYKARLKLIYEAALRSSNGFKLFLSAELTNAVDIVEMVSAYGTHPNAFEHQGKVVLSTYGQNDIPAQRQAGVDWAGFVFPALAARGVSVFFIPHFWPDPVAELPTYADGRRLLKKYADTVAGLFLFGGAGLPVQLAQSNADYTRAVHEAGKVFMASVTPHYWGCSQREAGRRYFEFDACEGLALQWHSIIEAQPDWVEIVTWNDWNESTYVAPTDDPGKYLSVLRSPRRNSHAAYLEFSKRYIEWYKTGKEPIIDRDAVFCSYRVHSLKLIAANPTESPVNGIIGDTQDIIPNP